MKKSILYILLGCALSGLSSCSEDKLGETIFPDVPLLDEGSATYGFDLWLDNNYLKPYNLDFRYKLQDVGSDMDYNLVPAKLSISEQMARLVKYLWFDVYGTVVNEEFLKYYGPRIIHLIGSSAYNPAQGTEVLGTAEGGLKVTLYNCNNLNISDINMMNEYFFKTMHHEFAHILHQKKSYPKDFDMLCAGYYQPNGWAERTDEDAWKLGFASNYGSSEGREDFVEVIANFIIKNDAEWNHMLEVAATGTEVEGRKIIEQKLDICKTWLRDSWEIDLDKLRAEVHYRQDNLDMDELMKD